jgi:putative transposase
VGTKLKVDGQALFQGSVVKVIELIGHDSAVVSIDGQGVVQTKRAELIALADPEETFRKSPLATIPDEIWEKAKSRNEVAKRIAEMESGRSEAVTKGAKALQVSERHLWRLIKSYQQHQTISSMMPQPPGRKPGSRALVLEVERLIGHHINEFYLQRERPSRTELKRRIVADCRKHELPVPGLKTIDRRLRGYETHEAQKKRLGAKKAKYAYLATPGHVDVCRPFQRIEIDHTPLDVFARSDDPLCAYVGRPWLTIAIDVFTRCVVGLFIGFEPPSALAVALCLAHLALPKNPLEEFGVPLTWPMFGLPEEIVVDNGKDFCSRAFIRGCSEHGILLSYRPVGSPHYGGTIERLIGTMVGRCHILPGTTKRSVQARGEYPSEAKAALTLSEIRRWFVEQVLGGYHQTEHRMLRKPPWNAWHEAPCRDSVRHVTISEMEFLVTFLPGDSRKLTRSGIEMHRLQYWHEELGQWVGQGHTVHVHYDPRDISIVYVRTPVGTLVKASVTTPGIRSISLAEWNARKQAEASLGRAPERLEIADASQARADQIVAVAKASRSLRRRKATQAAGDRWVPTPPPAANLVDELVEPAQSVELSGRITFFDIEDNSHDFH